MKRMCLRKLFLHQPDSFSIKMQIKSSIVALHGFGYPKIIMLYDSAFTSSATVRQIM